MTTCACWILGLALLFGVQELWAQSVSDNGSVIAYKRLRVTPAFSFSDIDYDVARSADDFSVDSEILGLEVGKGLSPRFDATGQIIYLANAHLDTCDGNGFALGFGSHAQVLREKRSRILLNGQFSYAQQRFHCPDGAELKNSSTELSAGASYNYRLHANWDIFGGLRLTPYSQGRGKNVTNDVSYEFKRESVFNLTLGGSTNLIGNRLRAELLLFGETTFILGYSIGL